MGFFIIFAIILPIMCAIGIMKILDWHFGGICLSLILCIFLSLFGCIFSAGISCAGGETLYKNGAEESIIEATNINISSFKDDFYVNRYCNTDDEQIIYNYIEDTENGQIAKTIRNKYTYINNVPQNSVPHITHYELRFKNPIIHFFFTCPDEYYVYIPEGTVTDSMSIDLE